MTSSFADVCSTLDAMTRRRGIDYTLDRLRHVLAELGNPQNQLPPIIHVAGTNGKGSTIAFMEGMLIENGYRVGKYISPHIQSYCERIQVNQSVISETDFCRLFHSLSSYFDILTPFELLTVMAFQHFKAFRNIDYILLETGLGGRLDATNVVHPVVCAITSIGMDHEAILGDTIRDIAYEKAGIIKPQTPVVTCQQSPDAMRVIRDAALKCDTTLCVTAPIALPENSPLTGTYQNENFSIAHATLNELQIQLKYPIKGHHISHWGRMTARSGVLGFENTTVILDVAHNTDGISNLISSVRSQYPNVPFTVILGILQTKTVDKIIPQLNRDDIDAYLCPFSDLSHQYADIYSRYPFVKPWHLTESCPIGRPVTVFTGSHFFISQLINDYPQLGPTPI